MIYDRIKILCREYKISVNKLEEELKISKGSLCKIDVNKPSAEKMQKIADFFAVSTDYLLGKNEDEIYDVRYEDEYYGINRIGEYLKETRENKGYSTKELSTETGISEKVLIECEDGISEVKSNIFRKILKTYEMTQLDFENEHNILNYEARPEFHGDYNASYAFDQALEHDQSVALCECVNLSKHEKSVITAYRNQPEMQPAVDKLLGIDDSLDLVARGGKQKVKVKKEAVNDWTKQLKSEPYEKDEDLC